ncbi:MAG: hypothetical protein PHE21_00095 [Candidatus Dojkabacteria bacterium]|jgi:hypothetical protein|nr:hypothetical protein [Candidatus Dojkabacteria bacterium]
MKDSKISSGLKERVLEVRITKLEGALIKKIRDLDYGRFTVVIHKIEGQPVRVEVTEVNSSTVLQARDGLDLEGATYVADAFKLKSLEEDGNY